MLYIITYFRIYVLTFCIKYATIDVVGVVFVLKYRP